MPSVLNATTTNGIAVTGDNSGALALQTNNGTTAVTIDTSQNVGIGTSSPAAKLDVDQTTVGLLARFRGSDSTGRQLTITSSTTANTGDTYTLNSTGGSGVLAFATSNTERMRITSGGDVGIGTASPAARFQVKGSNTADSTACFSFINSANTLLFGALNSGQVYTGGAGGSPYNNTTGSGANLFVGSDGLLQRSTSSLKYKKDIQNATHGLTDVLKLRPVTYKGINDGDKVFGGLIAEEVHEAGLTEFVQYAKDGSPDALAYGHMVSLLTKAIQELNAKVEAQAVRIAELEGAK